MQFYSFLVSGAFCDFFNFQTISCFARGVWSFLYSYDFGIGRLVHS